MKIIFIYSVDYNYYNTTVFHIEYCKEVHIDGLFNNYLFLLKKKIQNVWKNRCLLLDTLKGLGTCLRPL